MKRFICMMLTLIMLVSLVPATAITASAASYATSEAAITVLKKMTTFKGTCYRVADTQEFRIGYGTVCEKEHEIVGGIDGSGTKPTENSKHTISEREADKALRKALGEMDKKVNAFASSNKLSLKQNQHDALVVFSYGVGTAWMNGNGPVKTAIVNNAGVNEMLSAMLTVGNDMNRRKIEVNMYFNGVYSNVVPGNFAEVTYDANGGSMAHGENGKYVMQFDTSASINHVPSPLQAGSTFLGWYLDYSKWMPKLTADCAGKTLVALWQRNGMTSKDALTEAKAVNYTLAKSALASSRLYSRPDGDHATDKYVETSTIEISNDFVDADGARWSRIKGTNSWVLVRKGSGGNYGGGIEIDVTVTVTNSYLNRRVNASTSSAQNGTYHKGDKVRIINTANGSGMLWGQVAEDYDDNTPIGWIALMYTNWNSVKDDPEYTRDPEESNTNAIGLATVTFNGYVQLRKEPGTDNKIVGSLYKNDTVEIFEIKTVNGHQWGRTKGGWLCLTYTSLTMTNDKNYDKYVSSEGALNYTFTGKVKLGGLQPKVSPNIEAEYIEQYYTKKNDKGKVEYEVELWPELDEDVTITNMVIASDGLWVRISWRVDLDRNGKDDTTKSGWIRLKSEHLSTNSTPISMNPTNFTTVSNGITVRTEPDSGAAPVQITLNKGVQVEIREIALTGENIWGYLDNEHVVGEAHIVNNTTEKNFNGWVNLATKNFTRSNLPVVEEDEELKPIGQTAKVVGASSVNVRITGSTTATKVGSLPIGTVANILQYSEDGKWCNLDIDVDHNPETGSWVSKQYLSINDGYVNGAGPDSGSDSKPAPIITGKGIVANTYAGVNIRKGAGTGYAPLGKLLPGTIVDILEVTTVGAAKWARVKEGWICMDYVTMISEDVKYPESPVTPDGSTKVGSYEELEKTTTTAIYTGSLTMETPIFKEPSHEYVDENGNVLDTSFVTRTAGATEKVTVYELLAVKELHLGGSDGNQDASGEDDGRGHGSSIEVIETSYWARVDGGYIFNPQDHIKLNALDEKVHTVAGIETLNIRDKAAGNKLGEPLKQGTQVKITALEIIQDKVWGRTDIERNGTLGWVRLDYTAEGAYVVEEEPTTAPTAPPQPTIGVGDGVGGGSVGNSRGYRYKGTVTGAPAGLKVRSTPSTDASITTTLKNGAALVIYETTSASGQAWGRCDAGWVYLYYVNMTPVVNGVVEVHVMGNNQNYTVYTDSDMSGVAGTYTRQAVVEVTEAVGDMCKTELGWVSRSDFLK